MTDPTDAEARSRILNEFGTSFFVEAAVFLLVAAAAGFFAYHSVQAGAPPLPEQAIEEAKETKKVLEGEAAK